MIPFIQEWSQKKIINFSRPKNKKIPVGLLYTTITIGFKKTFPIIPSNKRSEKKLPQQ